MRWRWSDEELPKILAHGTDLLPRIGADIEALRFTDPRDIPGQVGDALHKRSVRNRIFSGQSGKFPIEM